MTYGGYSSYSKLNWVPDKDKFLTVKFRITPKRGKTLKYAGEATAAESSIGTWTTLSTMRERVLKKMQARVYKVDKKNKIVHIAYPVDLFEPENMPQLLSDIAGNIFGMKDVNEIRLLDFEAPKKYLNSFKGPKFGRDKIRTMCSTLSSKRPHLGTIVKPKVGLTPKEQAKVAYDSWVGGLDFVKDDENLTSHPFSKFEDRLEKMLEARDKAKSQTGKTKLYAPNITSPAHTMLKRAELVETMGGKCMMIDILTAGFSAVQYIRDQELDLFIHAHRAMHAAITRNKRHGISMLAIAKMARMCGVDQLHIGTAVGKMEGSAQEVLAIHNSLNSNMGKYKKVFSVCSGGLSPLHIPSLIKIFGTQIIIQAGGGVHGHPKGTVAGAKAMVQATEAAMHSTPLKTFAKKNPELREAIKKWGK